MAKPKKFTPEELAEHLEAIDHNWHRHGGEAREELELYLKRLYDSLPAGLKHEHNPLLHGAEKIKIFSPDLEASLTEILGGDYNVPGQLEAMESKLRIWGATSNGVDVFARRSDFLDLFDLYFSEEEIAVSLWPQVKEVRAKYAD